MGSVSLPRLWLSAAKMKAGRRVDLEDFDLIRIVTVTHDGDHVSVDSTDAASEFHVMIGMLIQGLVLTIRQMLDECDDV